MKFKKLTYYSVFTLDNEMKNAISIEFPDLPGCISCAYSYSQARKFAKEALILYLDGMKLSDSPNPSKPGKKNTAIRNISYSRITVLMVEKKEYFLAFASKDCNDTISKRGHRSFAVPLTYLVCYSVLIPSAILINSDTDAKEPYNEYW